MSIPTSWQLAALVPLTLVSAYIIRQFTRDRIENKGHPLPPGPIPLPFLGSALSVDIQEPFRTYTEWRATYGGIMYIRLLGMDVVVLNSPSIAVELLAKRAQIYSDRPFIATLSPYGHDPNFAFAPYGDHLKLCRRIFHETFGAAAVVNFHSMQLRKARQLMSNVMTEPSDYVSHYSTFASAIAMCSIYDYDPSPRGDHMVSTLNNFIKTSFPVLMPEKAALLKVFPFLLHMPDWLPGSSIKHEAKVARELGTEVVEEPYQYTKRRMESKEDINPSMVSGHITRLGQRDESHRSQYEKALKHTSFSALIGSGSTTSSVLMSFTLAMVKNPRVWKRAQAEIDTVMGTGRLPEFDDRLSLPYVDAIMRETMRWQPPGPLAVHATVTSDIYNGFYIPKGATVLANIWAMSRDEIRYPNAEKFIPERFLDGEGMLTNDTADFVYGFGRRICPGRHAADATLWIAIATMLATFDFNPARDGDGRVIEFEPEFINGVARHLSTFPCCITPRAHIDKGLQP